MTILLKLIYKVNAIPTKIPMVFFNRNGKTEPKICKELQGILTAEMILKKKKFREYFPISKCISKQNSVTLV